MSQSLIHTLSLEQRLRVNKPRLIICVLMIESLCHDKTALAALILLVFLCLYNEKCRTNGARLTCLSSFCCRRLVPSSSKELQRKEGGVNEAPAGDAWYIMKHFTNCFSSYSHCNRYMNTSTQYTRIYCTKWSLKELCIDFCFKTSCLLVQAHPHQGHSLIT